jgi:hypothetical protein
MWRAGAAGVSAVAAAAAGVVTALVTAHPSLGLWVALGVLVVIGAGLQAAAVAGERRVSRARGTRPDGPGEVPAAGDVTNTISGGTQHGPVFQGRDFSGLTFGSPPPAPLSQAASPPPEDDGTP